MTTFERWLLWNIVCRRGRRCADVVIDELAVLEEFEVMPVLSYTCGGCGTIYRWTPGEGRVRIK